MSSQDFERRANEVGDRLDAFVKKHPELVPVAVAFMLGWFTGAVLPAWFGLVAGGVAIGLVGLVVWARRH